MKARLEISRYMQQSLLLWAGVYGIAAFLKMRPISTLILAAILAGMLRIHLKKYQQAQLRSDRFREAAFYMDTILYAFLKEQKILQALEDAKAAAQGKKLQEAIRKAISHLEQDFDETEMLKKALEEIEKEYPCARIHSIHRFMLHAEYYGGKLEVPVSLLLEDKNQWEKRILSAQKDRQEMFRQVLLSTGASLMICSMILYLPVMEIDISKNTVLQILTLAVLAADDLIICKAQNYLMPDWLQLDREAEPEAGARAMKQWREFDEKREKKKSLKLAALPMAAFVFAAVIGKKFTAVLCLGIGILLLYQHRIGHFLLKKRLIRMIQSAFPQWLLDLLLLLQSENVQVALQKSLPGVPSVLREELKELLAKLELMPEQAWPYQEFLKEFRIPEVQSAMSMLYSLSSGNSGNTDQQIREMTRKNQQMLDIADTILLKDKSSGMYLLFLAPVLTASVKLAGDMTVFLLAFIRTAAVF